MRGPLAIVAAGGSFAAAVLAAGLLGVWLGGSHHPEYVLFAVLGGIVIGGYSAYRLVAASLAE